MRALLATSVLIGAQHPGELEGAISAGSLAELRFGVLVATDADELEPLPIDKPVAREWGRPAAAVRTRGGQPRRRAMGLATAAAANVHRVPLLTHNTADFQIIADLVDVRAP